MAVMKFGTYQAPNSEPITTDLDWWEPVEGTPSMKTWIENQTDDGKFLTGYWEATPAATASSTASTNISTCSKAR
ncbi:hypothetical protein [Paracoccus cavernae]|uniref:hypothetical protein n=1 Tax=Paracoccus cavernae TaxID=1571207 RepID=UPI0036368B84